MSVLLTLIPFIEAGVVHLVPDPTEFDADFRRMLMAMIEERTANWKPKKEEMRQAVALAKDDTERLMLRLPHDELRRRVRKSQPDISPELLESTIEHIKEKLVDDPLALLQPLVAGKDGGELQVFRGMNLELALFLAHLTGAAIYTDDPASWRQLHEHTSAAGDLGQPQWVPLAEKLLSLAFTIELNPLINLETRSVGKLRRARRAFWRIWNAALAQREDTDLDETVRQLAIRLDTTHVKTEVECNTCSTTAGPSMRLSRRMQLSAPAMGFNLNSVHRLLVMSGRTNYIESVPMALFIALDNVEDEILTQRT